MDNRSESAQREAKSAETNVVEAAPDRAEKVIRAAYVVGMARLAEEGRMAAGRKS